MNERVEQILANAKQAVETGLAETDSQQVYELAERLCDVTELACDMWPRLVDVVKALERLEEWAAGNWGSVSQCDYCGREWTIGLAFQHDAECPFAVLDKWQLRGVWRGEGDDASQ